MDFCRACESKRAYVTLSLVGAVGVSVVLLQISWVLPNAAYVPALSVSQPGILPTPAQPDPDGGVCEALAPKKHFYLFSAVLLSLLAFFSVCALFQKVTNMTPGIGGWDSARETQMSGARVEVQLVSSFWYKDTGQLSFRWENSFLVLSSSCSFSCYT